jgi:hypothetical protein
MPEAEAGKDHFPFPVRKQSVDQSVHDPYASCIPSKEPHTCSAGRPYGSLIAVAVCGARPDGAWRMS